MVMTSSGVVNGAAAAPPGSWAIRKAGPEPWPFPPLGGRLMPTCPFPFPVLLAWLALKCPRPLLALQAVFYRGISDQRHVLAALRVQPACQWCSRRLRLAARSGVSPLLRTNRTVPSGSVTSVAGHRSEGKDAFSAWGEHQSSRLSAWKCTGRLNPDAR